MIQKFIFGVESAKGEKLAPFLVSIPPYAFTVLYLVRHQEQLYTLSLSYFSFFIKTDGF
jgi:hypothetical protein